MQKLEISQIMALSDKLEKNVWILTLIDLNNKGQLEHFFELIGRKDLLQNLLKEINGQKTR